MHCNGFSPTSSITKKEKEINDQEMRRKKFNSFINFSQPPSLIKNY